MNFRWARCSGSCRGEKHYKTSRREDVEGNHQTGLTGWERQLQVYSAVTYPAVGSEACPLGQKWSTKRPELLEGLEVWLSRQGAVVHTDLTWCWAYVMRSGTCVVASCVS